MVDLPPTSVSEHFGGLTDPRRDHLKEHRLVDIVTITLCAVICGADDWVACGDVRASEGRLAADVPGAARRDSVARHVRPGVCAPGSWRVAPLLPELGRSGGRCSRRAGRCRRWQDGAGVARSTRGKSALHLVSAWATASDLVLGPGGRRHEVERDHGDPGPPALARTRRHNGHDRCDGVPDRDRRPDRRARRRLRAHPQRESSHLARAGPADLCRRGCRNRDAVAAGRSGAARRDRARATTGSNGGAAA